MRKIAVIILFGLSVSSSFSQNFQKLFVGTFTSEGAEGIYLCNFDIETGDITLDKTFKGIDNPSFLKISPNKKYLYSVSRATEVIEKSGGFVSAYRISGDGTLKFLNKQISNGSGPCHVNVSPDGKFVAIATYGGGTTSLYPVNEDGSLALATSIIVNEGSGLDDSRQDVPHAHSIKFSPFSNQVFSADLGTDQFNIFSHEGDQLVESGQKFVKLSPGAGPRHFDFHPNGEIIYVINELNSTITSFKLRGQNWSQYQTITTLPPDFEGTSYCADIHVSDDGRFLYGSNRGHNSIAVFSIDSNSNKITSKGMVSVEGDWPRNFTLTPDGKYMLVANQNSGNITVFKIHPETGVPEFTGKEIKLPSPVCLEFL